MKNAILPLLTVLKKPIPIAPLITFRLLFGLLMLASLLRFMAKDWITLLYVKPTFFFSFYGFEWVKPLGEIGLYSVFIGMLICCLLITVGLFYRVAIVLFFLLFTYVELLDKTNYLNHYYFVSLVSFLLIFVPAHRSFSLDVWRKPSLRLTHIPYWVIGVFQLQLGIVYFYAGLAKLNYDWLCRAMPLSIWLAPKTDFPIIGQLFSYKITAYLFSWGGALYDLTIPFFLLIRKTRLVGYLAVIGFHVLTGALFPIGMFPYIMIALTLLFFSPTFHEQLLKTVQSFFYTSEFTVQKKPAFFQANKLIVKLLLVYVCFQLLFPFRYLCYPNHLFWTEQGYRFSWRVMLMEKEGVITFYVKDPEKQQTWEVYNRDYLTALQEKMMSTQPDMIVQFAHYLEKIYQVKGIATPIITAEAYVSLNGRRSKLFIDPTVDLTKVEDSFRHKDWILPFAY